MCERERMRERHRRDWGISVCREREDEGETQEGLGYQGVCERERMRERHRRDWGIRVVCERERMRERHRRDWGIRVCVRERG